MIVYRQGFATMLYNSVIMQSLLIWIASLLMGGYSAAISLALSCLSIILMWLCSLSFCLLVAFILPVMSSSPVPFVSSPWLVVGLFVAPALIGALAGQYMGYLILQTYLLAVSSGRRVNLSTFVQSDLAKLDAERWLFKGGLVQWLALLILGNYYKIGSSYLALVWLVSPALACKLNFTSTIAWWGKCEHGFLDSTYYDFLGQNATMFQIKELKFKKVVVR